MTNNSEPPPPQQQVPPAAESNESIESQHRQVNSSHVYIKDKTHGWLPGVLVNTNEEKGIATVICKRKENFNKQEVKVNLGEYGPSKSLPLQCVNSQGSTVFVEDLRDLAYSNEASILYNLKERYDEQRTPYTRATNNVMVAINPYKWIDGLYAERIRTAYAENIVWKANRKTSNLPPHIYEISSMALKGILTDEVDQTIVVSGESGSGKTVSSKILMAHLATFHELKAAYVVQDPIIETTENKSATYSKGKKKTGNKSFFSIIQHSFEYLASLIIMTNRDNDSDADSLISMDNSESDTGFVIEPLAQVVAEDPEELKQKNLIVQRVIDSNPLLEAFGNAKTCLNDNSSRFSRYSKLQFHVEDGIMYPVANIAGSTCHTFLLEKSRVVSHDSSNDERTFHIFYQLMKAPKEERERIWKGLGGKTVESFKCVGTVNGQDEYTNRLAWKNTISALNTIGVIGKELQTLLMAVCIVMQLGNIIFIPNPLNEEEAIIANKDELKILSDMIGIPVHELSHCLTHKTMKAVHDSYQVPLKVADAKSTCDAFAKECYRVTFNWLVSKTNESTSADKNYKEANRVSRYRCISVLDICGFECFEVNGFEQLLINHANERLQKTFTETIIDAVMEEYNQEGITVEKIEHENNDTVIRFFEGKMGLMSLLNEECIRPQGSDAGFVNKIYASHSTSSKASKLVFHRHYQLSKTLFGIRHFAKDVTYDAVGFSMKNKDTLPLDVVSCAVKSTNDIIRNGIKPNESSSKRSTPRSKTALVGTSLWTSFERQMTNLFTQIKQTRVWFVRCIIPNNDKEPFSLDLKCALTQLRSVGLLTALKMSHASLPNKQRFEYILHRFWFMGGLGKKYAFGNVQGSEEEIRNDCEKMLTNMLTPVEDTQELFIMGRTKVYFREGSLEQLEAERSKAYDKGAMKIQARIRGVLSRKKYKALKRQSAHRKQRKVDKRFSVYLIPFAVLPLYLARYLIGTVRRPSRRLCRGSWH